MVLRSVYYECRRNNWITWFVPSARVWTHRGSVAGCVRGRVPSDSDDSSRGRVFRAAGALPEAAAGRRGGARAEGQLHVTSGHLLKNVRVKGSFERSLFWAKSQFGAVVARRRWDVGDRLGRGARADGGPAGAVRREQRARRRAGRARGA